MISYKKGAPIEYWSIYDSKDIKTLTYAEYQKLLKNNLERKGDIKYISKVYTVFNAKQMDGNKPYNGTLNAKKVEIDEEFSLPYYLLYSFGKAGTLDIVEDYIINTPFFLS